MYWDFDLSYLRGWDYPWVIGRNGHQGVVLAQLMEHPINQLHKYVRILLRGRVEGPSRILGLWRRDVYFFSSLVQFLR